MRNKESKKSSVNQVKSLSDREKIVFALHYNERLNVQDIASILHLEEQKIEEIISKTRILLRNSMMNQSRQEQFL